MLRFLCTNGLVSNLALATYQTKPILVALTLSVAFMSLLIGVLNEIAGEDKK